MREGTQCTNNKLTDKGNTQRLIHTEGQFNKESVKLISWGRQSRWREDNKGRGKSRPRYTWEEPKLMAKKEANRKIKQKFKTLTGNNTKHLLPGVLLVLISLQHLTECEIYVFFRP